MNPKRTATLTLAAMSLALLAACGDKAPSCADPATVSLVQQIYQQSFDKEHASMSPERQRRVQITSKNTKVTVESITTARSDESTGKKTCSAVLTAVMPQDAIPSDQRMLNHLRGTYEPQGAALEGNAVKGNVTYTVQRTEDSKEILVKLTGHLAFMGLFHDLAMLRVFDKSEAEIAKIAGEAPPAAEAKPAEPTPAEVSPVAQTAPAVATPAPTNTAPAAAPVAPPANVTTAAPAVTVPHLCTAAETPIFACSTGKKRASVCTGRAGGNEQLAYRIAPLDGAVEMEYPSAGTVAASAFQRGSQLGQDGTAVNFLSFDKGNYRYVVYAGDGENGRRGVVVEQGGKRIADLRCQSDAMSRIDPAQLQKMGLSLDERRLSLPLVASAYTKEQGQK
ncbi:MAG: hypothetical protein QE290_18395 [Acidovorax sp.]|uniref:hypothetical protein n=1 Tax=Acidovorax sp. TaxID=1872122 RepID=UPI00260E0257|nr:hypothetical protein [Acidovorax sp.]MDH4466004.1 hypothetical protein [Acidovorax sp.]